MDPPWETRWNCFFFKLVKNYMLDFFDSLSITHYHLSLLSLITLPFRNWGPNQKERKKESASPLCLLRKTRIHNTEGRLPEFNWENMKNLPTSPTQQAWYRMTRWSQNSKLLLIAYLDLFFMILSTEKPLLYSDFGAPTPILQIQCSHSVHLQGATYRDASFVSWSVWDPSRPLPPDQTWRGWGRSIGHFLSFKTTDWVYYLT